MSNRDLPKIHDIFLISLLAYLRAVLALDLTSSVPLRKELGEGFDTMGIQLYNLLKRKFDRPIQFHLKFDLTKYHCTYGYSK